MSKFLEEKRNENREKIKIGCCLELWFWSTRIKKDFDEIKKFLTVNNSFLQNQNVESLIEMTDNLSCFIDHFVDLISSDIDKEEKFCEFYSDFY